MNSRAREALSLPVDQLLSKTLAYDRIFGSDIKTIRDLIDRTWGAFHAYSGVGAKADFALNKALEKYGIDIDEYVVSLPSTASVPERISKYCFAVPVRIKKDLKKKSRKEVMWCATFDLPMVKRILKSLDDMGVHHMEPGDKIILETEELPSRIRNGLFLQGYYTEYDTLKLSARQISALQTLGPKNLPILSQWHAAHLNELQMNKKTSVSPDGEEVS